MIFLPRQSMILSDYQSDLDAPRIFFPLKQQTGVFLYKSGKLIKRLYIINQFHDVKAYMEAEFTSVPNIKYSRLAVYFNIGFRTFAEHYVSNFKQINILTIKKKQLMLKTSKIHINGSTCTFFEMLKSSFHETINKVKTAFKYYYVRRDCADL